LLHGLRDALSGRYTIDRELGRGGMATVYLARDLRHGRLVAIKVLRAELAASVGSERFHREIQTAAQLQHPHILALHDSGEADGVLFYVMPFVEGESLRERLAREHQLPLDDALRITRQVGDALAYAHSRGVVHRDIKPENILLSRAGQDEVSHALVADFGIARAVSITDETLTQAGIAVGTPAYMSPEQASAERAIDGRSDVYSLGCVLYEMLVGHAPYMGVTAQEVLARHLRDPLPPLRTVRPELPPAVERAVQTALAKSPADRYPTASAFTRALAPAGGSPNAARRSLVRQGFLALLVLAIVGTAFVLLTRQRETSQPAAVVPDSALAIAVLPFDNIGGDPSNEPFSDGVAEDLTTELRKIGRLNVKSRTSAFSFKGRGLTAQDVGRRLGARYVLTGSVQLGGDRRRVHAQLIDVVSGDEVWSDRYDSDAHAEDALAVQDTITRAIVGSLRLPLSAVETALLERRSTTDREAHALYLQGRYFFEKRDAVSLAKARGYFEKAIQLDSLYAQAWAGLGDAYSHSATFGYTPPSSIRVLARDAALRALALDSMLVEAHVARGFVALFLERDFATADRSFSRALQLDPRYAPAHQFRGWYLISAGRAEEALLEMKKAVQLDPFSLVINARLATMLYYARRMDEALAQAERTLELDSTFFHGHTEKVRALVNLGRCAEALAIIEKTPPQLAAPFRGQRGTTYARCGKKDAALAEIERIRAESATGRYITHYPLAVIHNALGNRDQAIAELELAADEGAWTVFTLLVEPEFDGYQSDPRFVRLLDRIGLKR
jgi:serine/threonine protein kinase/tetratricopeptide (TPR) repeat protein